MRRLEMKGAHPSSVGSARTGGIALSQSIDFIRDWYGNSEDGKDEGEECK
jgi:hypothetical protein